jgi:tetratricopeptide (TPR) repeat protein
MQWKNLLGLAAVMAAAGTVSAVAQDPRAVAREAAVNVPPSQTIPSEQRVPLSDEQRADIYMARKQYREAAEIYLAIKPQTHIQLNKAGIAYHQMGDLDTAKKLYERAIKLKKDYAEAINNLGAVWYAKKSYRRATKQYEKALQIAPRSASMYSNLGTAYFARKQYEKASAAYLTAMELDPDVFEHRSSQGVLLQERSVEERAKFNFYLAKTYAKSGQVDRALTYMRKALEYGFKEKQKFLDDNDFASVRANPEFEIVMKLEPRVL